MGRPKVAHIEPYLKIWIPPTSPYLVKDTFEAHIAGWNDRVEVDGDGEEEEENRRVVTIARSIFIFPIL